jgi:proline iminopeptidase
MMRVIYYTCLFIVFYFGSYSQQLHSFRNGNIELFYEVKGGGTPLYILTGGPGYPPQFGGYELMDSLQSQFTVVLLHQRGSGKSKNIICNEQTINVAAYVSDVLALMKARGDNKVILAGISWGGLLAQAFAVSYPAKVSKLILIASAPPSFSLWHVLSDNQFARTSPGEQDSLQILQQIFSTKSPAELEEMKIKNPEAAELKAFKEFIRIIHRHHYYNRKTNDPHFEEIFQQFNFQPIPLIDKDVIENKIDYTVALKKLAIPALIIYGRQDDQGESTFQLQKECLKNSKVAVLEQCGHEILHDQRKQFFAEIRMYLKK